MFHLPYSTKKKISNLVVGVADLIVNMDSAYPTTQQPSNLAKQRYR